MNSMKRVKKMTQLYSILKTSKLGAGAAPDMYTALLAQKINKGGSGGEAELSGVPPLTFRSNGTPLLDYLISGNTVQNGTPSPQNPVDVNGTGERTANFFDADTWYKAYKLPDGTYQATYAQLYAIKCKPFSASDIGKEFTFSLFMSPIQGNVRVSANVNGTVINGTTYKSTGKSSVTFTVKTVNDTVFLNYGTLSDTVATLSAIMLNTGSTALPFEPFGYKIPILSAGQTTPVYLGDVQTTRKIKKLVLGGTESWNEGTSNYYIVLNVSGRGEGIPNSAALSTHTESGVAVNNNGTALFFKKSVFVHSSLADFKTYLQQQYTAGTPVTVWYVLATPQTAVVNEPLMKIGDYADSISMEQTGVDIPTVSGTNVIDVNTTVKPSEIYIKYHTR